MFDEEQKITAEQTDLSAPKEISEPLCEEKTENTASSNVEETTFEESVEKNITEKEQKTEENSEKTDCEPSFPVFFEEVLTPELEEKKEIKKISNVVGFSFLIMSAIIFSFSFIAIAIFTAIGFSLNETYEILNEPAVSQVQQILFSIIIFTIPFILVCKVRHYRISDLISFKKPIKSTALPLFFVGMSICAFANIASSVAGSIFENFGVDYEVTYAEDPKGFFGFLLSLLATVIVPALVEEFACRGIVLGILRKFGDVFAIIVSAVLFGLMHSNFEQIPFAFFVGIGLGFITVKSGSIWLAVLVHACNNSISVIYSYFLSNFSVNFQNISYTVLLLTELILGILSLLFIKDEEFFKISDSDTKNTLWKKSQYFFFSIPIIIYVVFCLISSLKFFN